MERLPHDGQLAASAIEGFWQAMDTLRDMHSSRSCGTPGERRGRSGA